MINSNKKGFTLIELLVVIAIIGLLSTLAVVALNSARQKSRDSKRVADIKQVQTALELYFADSTNGYPAGNLVLGGPGAKALCSAGWNSASCGSGSTTYMGLVPAAPTPSDCASGAGSNDYSYNLVSADNYTITFCLGNKVGDMSAGGKTADPNGMR